MSTCICNLQSWVQQSTNSPIQLKQDKKYLKDALGIWLTLQIRWSRHNFIWKDLYWRYGKLSSYKNQLHQLIYYKLKFDVGFLNSFCASGPGLLITDC